MLIQQVRTETQHKEHALKVPLGEMQLIQQGQKGIVRAVKSSLHTFATDYRPTDLLNLP